MHLKPTRWPTWGPNPACGSEQFCDEYNLLVVQSRARMQRKLIHEFDVRIAKLVVRRLRGIRWRPESATAAVPPKTTLVATQRAPGGLDDGRVAVRGFLRERCEVTADLSDWIDLEDRVESGGQIRRGFRPALYDWCRQQGLSVRPNLQGDAWTNGTLPRGVKLRDGQVVKQIFGLVPYTSASTASSSSFLPSLVPPSWPWYGLQALEVAIHVLLFLVTPLALPIYTASYQDAWSLLLAPEEGVNGQLAMLWQDVLQPIPLNDGLRFMLPVYSAFWWEGFIFMLFVLLRLTLVYLELPLPRFVEGYRVIFSVALALHLVLLVGTLGIMGAWCLVAALVTPKASLPSVTAAVVMVLVVIAVATQMRRAAHHARKLLEAEFGKALQFELRSARERLARDIEADLVDQQAAESGGLAAQLALDEDSKPRTAEVTAQEIFQLLNDKEEVEIPMSRFQACQHVRACAGVC